MVHTATFLPYSPVNQLSCGTSISHTSNCGCHFQILKLEMGVAHCACAVVDDHTIGVGEFFAEGLRNSRVLLYCHFEELLEALIQV